MLPSTKFFADVLGCYGTLIHGSRVDTELRRESFEDLFGALNRLEGFVVDPESLDAIREARVHAQRAYDLQITVHDFEGGMAALDLSREAIWRVVLK